ncbi:MAG: CHAT domain-containing protein, partial [Burkholderiales bacterium]
MYDFVTASPDSAPTVFLDYSRITFRPPLNGLGGAPQGQRYVGVRIASGQCRIVDLGEAQAIDDQCTSMIRACSMRASARDDTSNGEVTARHLQATRESPSGIDLDPVAGKLYDQLVAPLEPIGQQALISTDGMLAAVPFHALVREGRWLVEDTDVAYCHSLLARASLSRRQIAPGTRILPSNVRIAMLFGDPDYKSIDLPSLPGTSREIRALGSLLQSAQFKEGSGSGQGKPVFDVVRIFSGAEAMASNVLIHDAANLPRVLHIAAHGVFRGATQTSVGTQPLEFGSYYRRWDGIGAAPITEFDDGLLRSQLILSREPATDGDPAAGAVLTALELASLNLLGCHLVVLSACETGAGTPEYGVGVLGFQYAVRTTCARAGLVSLWKVADQETAAFMIAFYQQFTEHID